MESLITLLLIGAVIAGGVVAPFKIPARSVSAAVIALLLPLSGFWPVDYLVYIWVFLIFTTKSGLISVGIFVACYYWGKYDVRN